MFIFYETEKSFIHKVSRYFTLVLFSILAESDSAFAYSMDSKVSPVDLNITTKALDSSIRNVIDNVLKSFSSDNMINVQNIPNLPQLGSINNLTSKSYNSNQFSNSNSISSQGVINTMVDFIKLSISLLFTVITVIIEILNALLNSLNSYRG